MEQETENLGKQKGAWGSQLRTQSKTSGENPMPPPVLPKRWQAPSPDGARQQRRRRPTSKWPCDTDGSPSRIIGDFLRAQGTMTPLLDSGCTRCLVSPSVVEKLGIHLRQLKTSVAFSQLDGTLAGGAPATFVTEPVQMKMWRPGCWVSLGYKSGILLLTGRKKIKYLPGKPRGE